MFPVGMISANTQLIVGSRVLTTDQWADYLLFRFWPSTKVFVDGRTDFYGSRVGGEYLDLWHGQGRWRALLDRYGFQTALIPPDWALCALLRQDPAWREIRADKQAVLFVKATGGPAGGSEGASPAGASERIGAGVLRNRNSRP
jgi:hypothetical protein